MDDRHLREILLNLHSRLSDNDRERLHFYLQNDVPRTLADDSSLSGTLKLMQSLFDQDKISENHFTFLIDALQTIQCFDAVRLLKEHQRRMRLSGCSQSTLSLASMMPSLAREIFDDDDEDDKYPTESFLLKPREFNTDPMRRYPTIDIIYDESHSMENNNRPMRIIEETETLLPKSKPLSWISSLPKKYTFVPYVLFLLVLTVLIVVVVEKIHRIHNLEKTLQIKEESSIRNQDGNNRTTKTSIDLLSKNKTNNQHGNGISPQPNQDYLQSISQLNNLLAEKNQVIDQFGKLVLESNQQQNISTKQWTGLLSEKNAAIDKLNQTIIDSQKQRIISLIKTGQPFGGSGGGNFDDSLLLNFTSNHYLSGFIISDTNQLDGCQFIYRSPYDNQSLILSPVHGNFGQPMNSTHVYHFDDDERVEEVIVTSSNQNFVNSKKIPFTTVIVKGFQFITTKGRIIPADISLINGDIRSERFPRYVLGYVTGKSGLAIDQLQFMWYRKKK